MRRINSSASVESSAGISVPAVDNNSNTSKNMTYLSSCETMVRRQDVEFDATLKHMTMVFERIQTLGNNDTTGGAMNDADGMLTYLQMRRALIRIGVGWRRPSSRKTNDYGLLDCNDDDISAISFRSTSSCCSGDGASAFSRGSDIIATDSQLLTLLATFVEMEERHRASKMYMLKDGSNTINDSTYHFDQGLFLPEFIQAYKLLVGGMHSFKSIPPNSNSSLCNRLKERTLQMLRPFGPGTVCSWQASDESYDDFSINRKRTSRNKKNQGSLLSNGDVKKIIASKDHVLAKIMEEHELEIDALSSNIEELKQEDQRRRVILRKRRKYVIWLGIILSGVLLTCGIIIEIRRRASISHRVEITREAENTADRKRIAQLKAQKQELEKKFRSAEGKIRYQVSRNNDLESKSLSIEQEINNINEKELGKEEVIEQCFASHLKFKEESKLETLKNVGISEELVWCQTRLQSQERKLEHVSFEGQSERGAINNSFIEDGLAPKAQTTVYLEVKYNKSIRKSIFLRQTYSAIAGVAVGALLQGLAPLAIKIFAPKVAFVPSAPVPTQGLEMVLVDGIFGSSIAFLLVRAIATFLMPL